MMQSDIDHNLFAGGNAGDEKLFVKFEDKPVQNKAESLEQGRPIYKEIPHISIRAAGSQNFVCRRASQADINRFPRHYAAFTQKRDMPVEGTLLSEWPLISRTLAIELEALEVKTVEQLLSMDDQNSQRFMGFNELKRKAVLFLEHAAGDAPMNRLQDELDARDQTIANQQTMIDAMAQRLNALEAEGVKDVVAEKMSEPAAAVTPKPRSRKKAS